MGLFDIFFGNKRKNLLKVKDKAEQGNANAQYELGECYKNGDGVKRNLKQAFHWFKKAAEQENAEAQFWVAGCYCMGDGVDEDLKQALHWFKKAAEQNHANAQYELAGCYTFGNGVEKDLKQAFHWLKKAAEQGYSEAQHQLAKCYCMGDGVGHDLSQEIYWLKKAAEQNHAEAQHQLAKCYRCGVGVDEDLKQALHWFKKAAEQNHAEAQCELNELSRNGIYFDNDISVVKSIKNENTTKLFHENKNNEERKDWFIRTRHWHDIDERIIDALIDKFGDNPLFGVFVVRSMQMNLLDEYKNIDSCSGAEVICSIIAFKLCNLGSSFLNKFMLIFQDVNTDEYLLKETDNLVRDFFETAIIIDENQISAYGKFAIFKQIVGKEEEAAEYARQGLEKIKGIKSENIPFHLSELKEVRDTEQNFEEIEKLFNKIIKESSSRRASKKMEEHLDLEKKAEQGDVGAQLRLGYFKQELQDLKQSLQEIKQAGQALQKINGDKKAAEQGDGEAQYKLGCCYYFGTGIEQDFKQAFHCIREASMQGNPEAWYWIGEVAKQGDAVASSQFVACYKSWEEAQKKKPSIW